MRFYQIVNLLSKNPLYFYGLGKISLNKNELVLHRYFPTSKFIHFTILSLFNKNLAGAGHRKQKTTE